ncbi:hypothetical protein [Aquihabitans sp. McL0605]|uniref:hypothetical protein n=1 Tax=Aquihabitans sp. McL0605 TaxID=3415671 RepID=UPI003CF73A29
MIAPVLAQTSAWTYVGATYAVAVLLIGGYAASIIARGRKVTRQLPPDERRWS